MLLIGVSIATIVFQLTALQALVLAGVLFAKGQARNRALALWLLVLAVDMSSSILYTEQLFRDSPHWIGLRFGLPYLYGPLLLLYVRTLLSGRFARLAIGHWLPFLWLKLYELPVLLDYSAGEKLHFLEGYFAQRYLDYVLVDLAMPAVGLAYVWIATREVAAARERLAGLYSNRQRVEATWLRVALAAQAILWFALLALYLPRFFGVHLPIARNIYMLVSLWVFVIAYAGLWQPLLLVDEPADSTSVSDRKSRAQAQTGEPAKLARPRAPLPEDQADWIRVKLDEYMRSEPWRDGDLSVQDVATAIDVPMHRLSQLINQEHGCNFFQFVNRFRIAAACAMLDDPASAHFNILEIAYQSGFNSKSAFNAVFKDQTGQTPRQYRRRMPTLLEPPAKGPDFRTPVDAAPPIC